MVERTSRVPQAGTRTTTSRVIQEQNAVWYSRVMGIELRFSPSHEQFWGMYSCESKHTLTPHIQQDASIKTIDSPSYAQASLARYHIPSKKNRCTHRQSKKTCTSCSDPDQSFTGSGRAAAGHRAAGRDRAAVPGRAAGPGRGRAAGTAGAGPRP